MKNRKYFTTSINFIMYVILIGIIISLLIGKSIIIGKEKQIIKEMTQSENEANLQTQIDQLNSTQQKYASDVQAYKKQIAEAITAQGVTTSENAEGSIIAENISKILQAKTSDATATAADIALDKTAYVDGELITGTNSGSTKKFRLVALLGAYGGSWVGGRAELYDAETGELIAYVGSDLSKSGSYTFSQEEEAHTIKTTETTGEW